MRVRRLLARWCCTTWSGTGVGLISMFVVVDATGVAHGQVARVCVGAYEQVACGFV